VHARLGRRIAVGVLALDLERGVLDPGFVAGLQIEHGVGVARRSHQRVYMRSSISAQSWLSVPPAPGWIWITTPRPSFSPESRTLELEIGDLALEGRGLGGDLDQGVAVAVGHLDQLEQVLVLRGRGVEGAHHALGGLQAGR
jgi:hypothetical protein